MRLIIIAALLLPSPSFAAPGAPKTQPDKMVCKPEPRTGSRVMGKICKTAAEWAAIEEQAKRNIGEIANQPRINPVSCGGSRPC